jgi:hypothetical protein
MPSEGCFMGRCWPIAASKGLAIALMGLLIN